jgi:peptidase S41-like protein
MLASLLVAAALALAPAAASAAAAAQRVHAPADPCDGVRSLAAEAQCSDGPLCSARERVQLACQVRDAMEKRYVFLGVKGRLLSDASPGFDARAHLDACVAAERAIPREDDPLRFYDRMRLCLAAYRDGHLMVGAPARLPQVALGVGLRLVDGRVVIANHDRKVVSYLKTVSGLRDLDELLAVGNEVVEIDGRPIAEALADLTRYLPASSDAARRERAVDALTRRDFAFPERSAAALTVSVQGRPRTVELPWWVSREAEKHVMARAWLRRTGVASTELLSWRYDEAKDTWDRDAGGSRGYLRTDTILPPRDAGALREYVDEGDHPAVRLGEVVRRRDRAFCYLQILTFQTETLGTREGRQPFPAVIDGFVRQCKEKDLDLVLDLRQNGGGYISHSTALVASLAGKQRSYPAGALLVRATTQNQLVFQQRMPALGAVPARNPDDDLDPAHVAEAIGAAQRARQEFTPALLEAPVRASETVGGYGGRVVALVSPTCTSACERAAGLLRAAGRATLVGAPTEGAGGSQQEAKNLPVRWADPDGLLWISIPNAAMGVQAAVEKAGDARRAVGADEFFAQMALENRPVQPDVPYETTLADVTGHNRGWLERAESVLFAPSDPVASAAPAPAGP